MGLFDGILDPPAPAPAPSPQPAPAPVSGGVFAGIMPAAAPAPAAPTGVFGGILPPEQSSHPAQDALDAYLAHGVDQAHQLHAISHDFHDLTPVYDADTLAALHHSAEIERAKTLQPLYDAIQGPDPALAPAAQAARAKANAAALAAAQAGLAPGSRNLSGAEIAERTALGVPVGIGKGIAKGVTTIGRGLYGAGAAVGIPGAQGLAEEATLDDTAMRQSLENSVDISPIASAPAGAAETGTGFLPFMVPGVGTAIGATEMGGNRYEDVLARGEDPSTARTAAAAEAILAAALPMAGGKIAGPLVRDTLAPLADAAPRTADAAAHAAEAGSVGLGFDVSAPLISEASGDQERADAERQNMGHGAALLGLLGLIPHAPGAVGELGRNAADTRFQQAAADQAYAKEPHLSPEEAFQVAGNAPTDEQAAAAAFQDSVPPETAANPAGGQQAPAKTGQQRIADVQARRAAHDQAIKDLAPKPEDQRAPGLTTPEVPANAAPAAPEPAPGSVQAILAHIDAHEAEAIAAEQKAASDAEDARKAAYEAARGQKPDLNGLDKPLSTPEAPPGPPGRAPGTAESRFAKLEQGQEAAGEAFGKLGAERPAGEPRRAAPGANAEIAYDESGAPMGPVAAGAEGPRSVPEPAPERAAAPAEPAPGPAAGEPARAAPVEPAPVPAAAHASQEPMGRFRAFGKAVGIFLRGRDKGTDEKAAHVAERYQILAHEFGKPEPLPDHWTIGADGKIADLPRVSPFISHADIIERLPEPQRSEVRAARGNESGGTVGALRKLGVSDDQLFASGAVAGKLDQNQGQLLGLKPETHARLREIARRNPPAAKPAAETERQGVATDAATAGRTTRTRTDRARPVAPSDAAPVEPAPAESRVPSADQPGEPAPVEPGGVGSGKPADVRAGRVAPDLELPADPAERAKLFDTAALADHYRGEITRGAPSEALRGALAKIGTGEITPIEAGGATFGRVAGPEDRLTSFAYKRRMFDGPSTIAEFYRRAADKRAASKVLVSFENAVKQIQDGKVPRAGAGRDFLMKNLDSLLLDSGDAGALGRFWKGDGELPVRKPIEDAPPETTAPDAGGPDETTPFLSMAPARLSPEQVNSLPRVEPHAEEHRTAIELFDHLGVKANVVTGLPAGKVWAVHIHKRGEHTVLISQDAPLGAVTHIVGHEATHVALKKLGKFERALALDSLRRLIGPEAYREAIAGIKKRWDTAGFTEEDFLEEMYAEHGGDLYAHDAPFMGRLAGDEPGVIAKIVDALVSAAKRIGLAGKSAKLTQMVKDLHTRAFLTKTNVDIADASGLKDVRRMAAFMPKSKDPAIKNQETLFEPAPEAPAEFTDAQRETKPSLPGLIGEQTTIPFEEDGPELRAMAADIHNLRTESDDLGSRAETWADGVMGHTDVTAKMRGMHVAAKWAERSLQTPESIAYKYPRSQPVYDELRGAGARQSILNQQGQDLARPVIKLSNADAEAIGKVLFEADRSGNAPDLSGLTDSQRAAAESVRQTVEWGLKTDAARLYEQFGAKLPENADPFGAPLRQLEAEIESMETDRESLKADLKDAKRRGDPDEIAALQAEYDAADPLTIRARKELVNAVNDLQSAALSHYLPHQWSGDASVVTLHELNSDGTLGEAAERIATNNLSEERAAIAKLQAKAGENQRVMAYPVGKAMAKSGLTDVELKTMKGIFSRSPTLVKSLLGEEQAKELLGAISDTGGGRANTTGYDTDIRRVMARFVTQRARLASRDTLRARAQRHIDGLLGKHSETAKATGDQLAQQKRLIELKRRARLTTATEASHALEQIQAREREMKQLTSYPELAKYWSETLNYYTNPPPLGELPKLRRFTGWMFLGVKPRTAIANLFQNFQIGGPLAFGIGGAKGYIENLKTEHLMVRAIPHLITDPFTKTDVVEKLGAAIGGDLGRDLLKAREQADLFDSPVDQEFIDVAKDRKDTRLAKYVTRPAEKTSWWMFHKSSQLVRVKAYVTGWKMADGAEAGSGFWKNAADYGFRGAKTNDAFARWFVDQVDFVYGPHNRPAAFRGIGSNLAALKNYTINAVNLLDRMSTAAAKSNRINAKAARVLFHLHGAALSGVIGATVSGAVGSAMLQGLIRTVSGDDKWKLEDWIAKAAGRDSWLARMATRGALPGNWGQSLSPFGNLVPDDMSLSNLAAPVGALARIGEAASGATRAGVNMVHDPGFPKNTDDLIDSFARLNAGTEDIVKGVRAATGGGLQTRTGSQEIPPQELTAWDAANLAIGVKTEHVTQLQQDWRVAKSFTGSNDAQQTYYTQNYAAALERYISARSTDERAAAYTSLLAVVDATVEHNKQAAAAKKYEDIVNLQGARQQVRDHFMSGASVREVPKIARPGYLDYLGADEEQNKLDAAVQAFGAGTAPEPDAAAGP